MATCSAAVYAYKFEEPCTKFSNVYFEFKPSLLIISLLSYSEFCLDSISCFNSVSYTHLVSNDVDNAGNAAGDAVKDVGDAAGDVVEGVGDAAADVAEGVSDAVGGNDANNNGK